MSKKLQSIKPFLLFYYDKQTTRLQRQWLLYNSQPKHSIAFHQVVKNITLGNISPDKKSNRSFIKSHSRVFKTFLKLQDHKARLRFIRKNLFTFERILDLSKSKIFSLIS